MSKKTMQVACAILERDGKVLAVQRSERMNLPFKWEFPGGKIHQGESPEQCVVREVAEELDIQIAVGRSLPTVCHDYPDFSVTLYPFICSMISGDLTLHEHKAFLWLSPEELSSLDWVAADFPIISAYCENLDRDIAENPEGGKFP
jgi:8-oxo-dGTP diphosphatase